MVTSPAARHPHPIKDAAGKHVLPVPYFSQTGPHADHAPGDCGPACICSVVHYLTEYEPSVNQVARAGGIPKDAEWSSMQQLAKAARRYGVDVWFHRPIQKKRIVKEIKAGYPVVCLVKYDLLATDDDPNQADFNFAHFVLVVGFGHETVIYHDPYRIEGDEFGEFRETRWSVFLKALMSTSKTPGNAYDGHGMTFND